ncbi:MAG: hypothetical protein FWE38_02060 [Firmicutes bacterium]|nr:hypothetical protein [Bacillota bacterium]
MGRRIAIFFLMAVLAIFLIFGFVLVFMFWSPINLSIFGLTGVTQRNSYTRYAGEEIREVLNHRRIMINAQNTDIQIRMRKPGQRDEGTITLFEDARGLSFNGINRTHIEWHQILRPNGEVYYRIVVHAPEGTINRRALLVLNITAEDHAIGGTPRPYSFVFNTGGGNVTFAADQDADFMVVSSVIIGGNSTGRFVFPNARTDAHPFHMDLQNLVVNGSATVSAPTGVSQGLVINGNYGNVTVGDVGVRGIIPSEPIISVPDGRNVTLSFGTVWGDVFYRSAMGTLTGRGHINGNFHGRTGTARINLLGVTQDAYIHANASTVTVTEIGGELDYMSIQGSLSVPRPMGDVRAETERANLTLGNNSGPITSPNGARGNITVENRYGPTNVTFARNASGTPSLNFVGFDGNIFATNVIGIVDISVGTVGRAQIIVEFRTVAVGRHRIYYGGSTPPGSSGGNIRISALAAVMPQYPFQAFNIEVFTTAGARDFTGWIEGGVAGNTQIGVEIPNMTSAGGRPWRVMGGNVNRVIEVHTSNTVRFDRR